MLSVRMIFATSDIIIFHNICTVIKRCRLNYSLFLKIEALSGSNLDQLFHSVGKKYRVCSWANLDEYYGIYSKLDWRMICELGISLLVGKHPLNEFGSLLNNYRREKINHQSHSI